jgi:hypothetical protein
MLIISIFDEKIGGHRCFFSAMGNKIGHTSIYEWSKPSREKKSPHT